MQSELLKRRDLPQLNLSADSSKCIEHAIRCDTRIVNLRIDHWHLSSYAELRRTWSECETFSVTSYESTPTRVSQSSSCQRQASSTSPSQYLLLLFHTHQTRDVFHCQRTNGGIIGARAEFRWEFPSALEIHKHYTARRHVYNGKWNRGLFAKRTFLMRFKWLQ